MEDRLEVLFGSIDRSRYYETNKLDELWDEIRRMDKPEDFDDRLHAHFVETGGDRLGIEYACEYGISIITICKWMIESDKVPDEEIIVIELLERLGAEGTRDAIRDHFNDDRGMIDAREILIPEDDV